MSSFSKQFSLDEISTENSIQNNGITDNNKEIKTQQGKIMYLGKKSINYFIPKSTFLESTKDNISKRKFTLDPSTYIRDFVPKPKHREIHFVPSKLKLNPKGYRKCKNNENNCYISCPNSEESDCSSSEIEDDFFDKEDQYENLRGNNQMKQMRKGMIKTKKTVHKVLSNEVLCNKQFDSNYLNDDLYSDDEDEIIFEENYMNDNVKYKESEIMKNRKTKRFNSCSILQILESNLKY